MHLNKVNFIIAKKLKSLKILILTLNISPNKIIKNI
jgi:hypothetical protein